MKLSQILFFAIALTLIIGNTIAILSVDFMRPLFPYWIGGMCLGLFLGIFITLRQKRKQKLASAEQN
jgi:uncharacterized membrane protein